MKEESSVESEQTPPGSREQVRSGILAAIELDVELRGGRTARLLVAAGVIGTAGAVGVILLLSGHPFGHHPPWHMAVFSAVWAGLLVVSFAIAFLRVRTPTLPLARAAAVGILGLGLAGVCGAVCPDPHFLDWWATTDPGGWLARTGGLALSALCFGIVTTLFIGLVSAFLLLGDPHRPAKALLPAAILFVLLAPGVVLQSVDPSFSVLVGWLVGAAAGAYLGVAGGSRAGSAVRRVMA